jgi:hypothetical protein
MAQFLPGIDFLVVCLFVFGAHFPEHFQEATPANAVEEDEEFPELPMTEIEGLLGLFALFLQWFERKLTLRI